MGNLCCKEKVEDELSLEVGVYSAKENFEDNIYEDPSDVTECERSGTKDVYNGWLWHKDPETKLWSKFWCSYQDEELAYYESLNKISLKGQIDLSSYLVEEWAASMPFAFRLYNEDSCHIFACDSQSDLANWLAQMPLKETLSVGQEKSIEPAPEESQVRESPQPKIVDSFNYSSNESQSTLISDEDFPSERLHDNPVLSSLPENKTEIADNESGEKTPKEEVALFINLESGEFEFETTRATNDFREEARSELELESTIATDSEGHFAEDENESETENESDDFGEPNPDLIAMRPKQSVVSYDEMNDPFLRQTLHDIETEDQRQHDMIIKVNQMMQIERRIHEKDNQLRKIDKFLCGPINSTSLDDFLDEYGDIIDEP